MIHRPALWTQILSNIYIPQHSLQVLISHRVNGFETCFTMISLALFELAISIKQKIVF